MNRKLPVWILALVAAAFGLTPQVSAHGGGTPQLVAVPAGPYEIYAWTNPNPIRVGTLHVSVALVDPVSTQAVLNAGVQVVATPLDPAAAAAVSSQATHAKATIKTYYETDMQVPATGPWQVDISYQDATGSGSASFEIAVQPKSNTRWLLIGIGAVVFIAVGWFLWPRKRSG
jgi:hypothetical protein